MKVHSFLLRDKVYTDVQRVRRPLQQLGHWRGAMNPESFCHALTEVALDHCDHCQCRGGPKDRDVSLEPVLHSVQEV